MGKNAKPKVKKDKVVKIKEKSAAVGVYDVYTLENGRWSEPARKQARGRRDLMCALGGYDRDGRLINLKPQVKVRAVC